MRWIDLCLKTVQWAETIHTSEHCFRTSYGFSAQACAAEARIN